jgi:septum formation topological specificity factor MinE
MWYIQLSILFDNLKNEILGSQLIDKYVNIIYDNIDVKYNEDYKILYNILEEHIIKYINNIKINKIELYI